MINQLPEGITIDSNLQFWAAVRKFATSSGQWYITQVGPFDGLPKAVLSQQRTNAYNEQKARDHVPPPASPPSPRHPRHQNARGPIVNEYLPQPWTLESEGYIHPRIQADNDRMMQSFFGGSHSSHSHDHEQGSEIQ